MSMTRATGPSSERTMSRAAPISSSQVRRCAGAQVVDVDGCLVVAQRMPVLAQVEGVECGACRREPSVEGTSGCGRAVGAGVGRGCGVVVVG